MHVLLKTGGSYILVVFFSVGGVNAFMTLQNQNQCSAHISMNSDIHWIAFQAQRLGTTKGCEQAGEPEKT